MSGFRILADVGGSNVRFSRSYAPGELSALRTYSAAEFPSFYDALGAYLDETGGPVGCSAVAMGVAGPVDDGAVELTNSPWTIEAARIETMMSAGGSVSLVNDLQAVALALPHLGAEDLSPIGEAKRDPAHGRTMLALNVGTGFGAAAAVWTGRRWIALAGESGHMTLGARSERELILFQDADSIEDRLSGRGVPALHAGLSALAGRPGEEEANCAEIFARAGADPLADELIALFSRLLGRVAGDLALAAAAWGGVYLCGGVVKGWAAAGGGAGFRDEFEAKGLMSRRMANVYSGVVIRSEVALFGLSHLPPADAM